MNRIAYLANPYPAISHTFIFREISTLRELGWEIYPVSVDRPNQTNRMTPGEQEEAQRTLVLKAIPPARMASSLLSVFARSPLGCLRMLRRAASFVTSGPKSPVKAVGYLAEAILLLAFMQKKGISHIHEHFANPTALVAMLCKEYGQVSYSLSIHGPDVFYRTDSTLLAEKIAGASFIRCISHYCRSQVMRLVPAQKWADAHVVRCGVNPDVYAPGPPAEQTVLRLLCVGRLCPAKGQHLLLEACALLARRNMDFELVLVGDGPDRQSLQDLSTSLQLDDRVHFRGALGQEKVREEYRQADIFVLPSFAEGVPVVLMEAMAMAKPVLSTRITGIPELIEHGVDGLLATPGDLEDLTMQLETLIENAELRLRLGLAGRKKILASYSQAANNRLLADLFSRYGG